MTEYKDIVRPQGTGAGADYTHFPTQSAVPAGFEGPAWFEDTGQMASYKNGSPIDNGNSNGTLLTDWKNGVLSGATNPGESFVLDNTMLLDGQPTVKCSFATAGGSFGGICTFTTPIYLSGFTSVQIPFYTQSNDVADQIGTAGHECAVWLLMAGGGRVAFNALRHEYSLIANNWGVISLTANRSDMTFGTITSLADLNSVAVIGIEIFFFTTAASAATNNVWIGPVRYGARATPKIVFTLDALTISQYTIARQILNKYGIRASFAAKIDAIGTGGYLTLAQVKELDTDGHEIIQHSNVGKTQNGYGLASDWPTAASITADILAGQEYLRTNGLTKALGYGVHAYTNALGTTLARTTLVLEGLRNAGMKGMRRIYASYNNCALSLATKPALNPLQINSSVSLTSTSTSAAVIASIDAAITYGEGLVITMHDVVIDSATPAGNQIKASDFDAIVAYAYGKIAAGQISNVTLSELSKAHYE